jgi:biotin synthase
MLNSIGTSFAEGIESRCDFEITRDQASAMIPTDPDQVMDLLHCADKIRRRFKQERIFKCGIVNAKSGRCSEDCAFCAQSVHHHSRVEVYPLRSSAELIESGLRIAAAGATHYSIVTSGTALNGDEIDTVCRAAEKLVEKSDVRLCASLGLLSEPHARKLRSAGIARYHHNIETAPSFFEQICTTHDFGEDIETLQAARSTGLEICSGGILGMGESWEQRLEMAFILKELDVDVVPLNFLNPIPGTRLENRTPMTPLEALSCIAMFRLIHPRRDITICGGREITLKDLQSWIFFAGANGVMIGNYLTTQGRRIDDDLQMIADLGLSDGRSMTPGTVSLHT